MRLHPGQEDGVFLDRAECGAMGEASLVLAQQDCVSFKTDGTRHHSRGGLLFDLTSDSVGVSSVGC